MDAKIAAITKTFDEFWHTWAARENQASTIDDIISFFDQDVTAIGTGEHEKGRNLQEVIQNFRDDFSELEVPIKVDFFRKQPKLLAPTAGMVEAECMLYIDLGEGQPIKFHLRISTVFTLQNNQWKIAHNHVSIPSDGQNIGESYPIDKLKAKNDRLERLVQERTQELEERTHQLVKEKNRTVKLLHNILPKVVATELINTGKVRPRSADNVSVLFSDFVGFTQVASSISPDQLLEELNEVFFQFDHIIKSEQLEKIKTIGDAYMAVCGLPEENNEHAFACIRTARRMLQFLQQRNELHPVKWKMRIGIHSGEVIAGVVGKHKFTYDLWGHTVNIASRLESAGQAGKINISDQTYCLIKEQIECEHRGKIKVKGGQEINMYFVV
ncbi:MAG: adenylate/guanylate cyclase domain-containing protein [Bacteroidota bacterium]